MDPPMNPLVLVVVAVAIFLGFMLLVECAKFVLLPSDEPAPSPYVDYFTITHVAGPVSKLPDGRVIQRCPICGFKLRDSFLDSSTPFPINAAVRCSEFRPGVVRWTILPEVSGRLPDDLCVHLVE